MMGMGIDVGVDPEADRSLSPDPAGNVSHNFNLLEGLHDECSDTHLESLADLFVRLADTRKEYLLGIVSATYGEFDLIPAHAVGSNPPCTQDVIQPVVGISLQ